MFIVFLLSSNTVLHLVFDFLVLAVIEVGCIIGSGAFSKVRSMRQGSSQMSSQSTDRAPMLKYSNLNYAPSTSEEESSSTHFLTNASLNMHEDEEDDNNQMRTICMLSRS